MLFKSSFCGFGIGVQSSQRQFEDTRFYWLLWVQLPHPLQCPRIQKEGRAETTGRGDQGWKQTNPCQGETTSDISKKLRLCGKEKRLLPAAQKTSSWCTGTAERAGWQQLVWWTFGKYLFLGDQYFYNPWHRSISQVTPPHKPRKTPVLETSYKGRHQCSTLQQRRRRVKKKKMKSEKKKKLQSSTLCWKFSKICHWKTKGGGG